ncbi:chromosomal partitioning protein [Candidatus Photodesmus blepharus]|uniref:Probable chromosome-partitioning protein ParB n=1 Tax=Candidatus Photodesmus blepharonis TaxID=1179155 RepID=A0A084CNU0_9GAMM|nr:ParB/RepB/Spo0J family partition protein [Candidatus Photodesmus blepharus]KEY91469.1 chromosomal partitioning protein [Candidatus Photodesmus blepharus]
MSKRGLGKGLEALLATSSLVHEKQYLISRKEKLSSDSELVDLSISQLKPGIYQPRKNIVPKTLEELADSIRSQGIIQPILVRLIDQDYFEIIAGERRWRAAKQVGLKKVPCLIKKIEDRSAIAIALIENIQRENLNVIDTAKALEQLQDQFKLTHQQIAHAIGKSRAAVSNLLRLNQLDAFVKDLVQKKMLEMGHARALLMLDREKQAKIAKMVASKKLTVRQTEQLVKKSLQGPFELEKTTRERGGIDTHQISYGLSKVLGAKVSIICSGGGKSKITITLDGYQKLERLIAKLKA